MGLQHKLPFKLFSPVGLAVALTVFFAIWLLLGDHKSAAEDPPAPQEKPAKTTPQVEYRWAEAEEQANEVIAQGQVVPWQEVVVRAQVAGQVQALVADQGTAVERDEVILTLTDEGRSERLAEAKATLTLRESEWKSAKALQKSQFTSETEISRLASALAQSKADLVAAQLAVKHSQPVAPFAGIVDRHFVEEGEWVSPGSELMRVVDVARLKVTADIPQQQVGRLQSGQRVTVELLDGRTLDGEVSFISYAANSQTRSYYIEVVTDNPELWRVAGASATIHVHLQPVLAHRFSPALLSLDKQGSLGVFAVDDQDEVIFYPVDILKVDNEAAIVQGLPERFRMITLGGGFVHTGQAVKPVEAAL